jgi:hypothetical protein
MTLRSLDDIWAPLIDHPAYLVQNGHGSFLTFEFGKPELTVREPRRASVDRSEKVRAGMAHRLVTVTGEWHFWVYCCNWSIRLHDTELAYCESPTKDIDLAIRFLDGQKLLNVARGVSVGSWLFTFDLGGVLRTWPYSDNANLEQWMLFERTSHHVLVARADGLCSMRRATIRQTRREIGLACKGSAI